MGNINIKAVQNKCAYLKLMNEAVCVSVCASVCARWPVVYACVRYEQSVPYPVAEPTNHTPPSSLFIAYSWLSVSAGLWLALNEQLTALSVSECYGNKISQSVQNQHQSSTGTETLFKRGGETETVQPSGRLTYWILLTACYLWYDSHNVSSAHILKC